MIDWDRVAELRSEIGEDGLGEVVDLFLDEVEGVALRLGTAPNPARFEDDLHFLKGSAWNLGFAGFGALCQDGERKAAAGRGAEIDIAAILACYGASRQEFMARVHEFCSIKDRSAAA
ncbi:Hpt domain-containing protein [Frigidibacter mobilis]|uniref:Hpt domain-containing protein n=1 Tax=Frigidibacter mobilis TaxID=1335048 RepID=A0A159ZA88_9RHOB|nr:Hpt domain-containing protein [Frigidibacter mobilis]AMY71770.1 Hpt domain-containing protein [Frigidibacter mobilis]